MIRSRWQLEQPKDSLLSIAVPYEAWMNTFIVFKNTFIAFNKKGIYYICSKTRLTENVFPLTSPNPKLT